MPNDDATPCHLLSWSRFHALCRNVARRIDDAGFAPDVIVAIARGGFAPARVLCDYLRVMELTSIRVAHYRAMEPADAGAKVVDPLADDLGGRNVLIVDDVSDTGDTFDVALAHIRERGEPAAVRTAILLHKTTSRFIPDFEGDRLRDWRWVIFPWARIEDLARLIAALPGSPGDPDEIAKALRERHGIRVARRTLADALRFGERWRARTGR
ncbi:MAG: phosphoribosyltransferase [Gammaproteobacteria bacterium]|nr:phosphoribosyltransferase [Gammaproteobacteria bacterium]